jgi:hypothetical protein
MSTSGINALTDDELETFRAEPWDDLGVDDVFARRLLATIDALKYQNEKLDEKYQAQRLSIAQLDAAIDALKLERAALMTVTEGVLAQIDALKAERDEASDALHGFMREVGAALLGEPEEGTDWGGGGILDGIRDLKAEVKAWEETAKFYDRM